MTTTSALWLCARQEFVLAARSRWTQTFAVVFALLALAVASSGYVLSGGSGFQDFARTAASLMQLVLLFVPLTSLIFGVMALTPDAGTAELLFSQPTRRRTILWGQLLGLLAALLCHKPSVLASPESRCSCAWDRRASADFSAWSPGLPR